MTMQCVILAGGLGTRLGDVAGGQPKGMVDVNGKPFLEYELALLRQRGISDVVLCIGHLGEKIQDYFGDGDRFGLRILYSVERGDLLGTAGAVKQAEPLLDHLFFLTYGDTYLRMDYAGAYDALQRRDELAMMVVFRNENQYERSNIVVADGRVAIYDKVKDHPGMDYINFGVSVIRREALARVPAGRPYTQEQWYADLIGDGQLAAFETHDRFYEIGTPASLAEFRDLVSAGATS